MLERAISNTAISNRRLRIDLTTIKEAIADGDEREVMWIGGGEPVADCLMKIGWKEGILLKYIIGTKSEEESGVRLIDY